MIDPVAITGVGAVSPFGVGARVLVDGVLAGASGIVSGEGPCVDFRADDLMSRREYRRYARFTQFAVTAAVEATTQAGWAELPYDADEIFCAVGTGLGGVEWFGTAQGGPADEPSALTVPLMMANGAAAALCMRLGLRGESYAVGGACAAGAQAVGAGLRALRSGQARAAVVGGAEAALVPRVRESFRAAGALSETGRCLPFGADRDGFVMGEGAGVLVLERLSNAVSRGAPVLGLILGYGASSDAYHLTASPPGAEPASIAIHRALADAGLRADDVCYVNAHGTGTKLNDENEIHALRREFGERLAEVPVSSTKAATGHLFGAGGAVEAILTVLALNQGLALPTCGLTRPDPELGPLHLPRHAVAVPAGPRGRIALSNSFGFGGHNSVLALAATPNGEMQQ
ncbi:beta-ketoacyl-[acyl-carrier-protein] synthase family protein [Micromonospora sp. DT53]|uniref:beta-ketoacyl-[acyl-carrier-protein] synthase family protein n=1 Tax=Micromonospora sp. DT53 TaxID=3393444 RepID=UPI003CEC8217